MKRSKTYKKADKKVPKDETTTTYTAHFLSILYSDYTKLGVKMDLKSSLSNRWIP